MTAPRRVVITGMGSVSCYGEGTGALWENIVAGRSGASLLDIPGAEGLPAQFAASVPIATSQLESMLPNPRAGKTMSRSGMFAMLAAVEAARAAGFTHESYDPQRVGTSLGMGGLGLLDRDHLETTFEVFARSRDESSGALDRARLWRNTMERVHPLTPLKALPNIAAANLTIQFQARGPSLTFATACTSGAQAIGEAARLIRWGVCDAMIAGGADSMVNPNGIIAFAGLGVLSRNNDEYLTAARPFDRRRDGFMLGEGAGMVILETLDACRVRGATPIAELIGYGCTSDAHRVTDEPADAHGSIAAVRAAIDDAGISADAVDYVHAHGTGTIMNDRTETLAIRQVFGRHAQHMPVSSTKSMIGHLIAAAGAIQILISVLAIKDGVVPPTINYGEFDPECDLDYVPNTARRARLGTVASNCFGFGGQNTCVIARSI